MKKHRGKRPDVRRSEAEERQKLRDKRSSSEQIAELDQRGQLAIKERARLER